ncbi:MAG: alkane 1-monooxygenase [Baekduia sp.]
MSKHTAYDDAYVSEDLEHALGEDGDTGTHRHAEFTSDDVDVTPATWKDGKRYAWLLGIFVPTFPFLAWGLVELTGWDLFWFTGVGLIFVIFPSLDYLGGFDDTNPPASVMAWLEQDRYYRWCTYLFLPVQFAGLIFSCWKWGSGELSTVAEFGLATTVGMVNGIAIATAHELGHKRESVERWLSKIALAPTGYGHFFVEHNRGHHVRVSTPEDPASSRMGESFWRFLPRTVAGSFTSAWKIEAAHRRRAGKAVWSIGNDNLGSWLMSVVLFAGLCVVFGIEILPWLLVQAVLGFSLLEVVNYLEHYGLARQKRPDGKYELTTPQHSWNANNTVSNVLLYHLQRHSDHHANPLRRYQALRHFDESPQLPTGYAGMILLAVLPPVWFRVMDRRLVEHYGGDVTKANIMPSKREKLLARWQPPAASGA